MPKIVITDTSCFIILSKVGALDLLEKLYQEVFTTTEVAQEFGEEMPTWVIIENPDTKKQKELEQEVDEGEASALALALEKEDSLLILDDYQARRLAQKLNLEFTGTIGVLIKAKLKGIIPSIRPIRNHIKQTNFRLSEELEKKALIEAGEN